MKTKTFEYIIGTFLAVMTIWAILSVAPKVYDIYKGDNKVEVKTDTVLVADTLYLDKQVTDTLPKTVYQTVVEHDTVYTVKGDSIESKPRVVILKKKLYRKPLNWKDRILYHYNTQHK